jgi:molecular chaperone GrpE
MMSRKKHAHQGPADGAAPPAGEHAPVQETAGLPEAAHPAAAPGEPAAGESPKAADTARIAELEDRLLRLMADFDNFRKRTSREKDELYLRANENLMLQLLPALDHLALAMESAKAHNADGVFLEGVRLVSQQLAETLAKFGLRPVNASGARFDPSVHEAISHMSSADVPENSVIVETRKGYMLGERLLRASQVVVSSGQAEQPEDGADG